MPAVDMFEVLLKKVGLLNLWIRFHNSLDSDQISFICEYIECTYFVTLKLRPYLPLLNRFAVTTLAYAYECDLQKLRRINHELKYASIDIQACTMEYYLFMQICR